MWLIVPLYDDWEALDEWAMILHGFDDGSYADYEYQRLFIRATLPEAPAASAE